MSHDYLRALYRAQALIEGLRSNADKQLSSKTTDFAYHLNGCTDLSDAYLRGYLIACTEIGIALADVATDVIENMQIEQLEEK